MANQSADSLTIQDLYAKSHAIVIGISDYQEEELRLKNPINDAREMAKILEEKYGFDSIKLMLDGDATKQKLEEIFDDYIGSDDITEEDRLLVYYSGHGNLRQRKDQQKRPQEESYLIPCDAKQGSHSTYLKMNSITDNCLLCNAKHVLLILDCCFSGTALMDARDSEKKPKKITDEYISRNRNKRAMQVIAATRKEQVAYDRSRLTSNHGAFTGLLLDLLNNQIDPDNDGILTASEVGSYLSKKLPRSKIPQEPISGHLEGSEWGEFIFNVFNVSKSKSTSERDSAAQKANLEAELAIQKGKLRAELEAELAIQKDKLRAEFEAESARQKNELKTAAEAKKARRKDELEAELTRPPEIKTSWFNLKAKKARQDNVLSIPIVNEENTSFPFVISVVSKYWGVDLPFSEAKKIAEKYSNLKGSIMIEGVELAERHGLSSMIFNSSLKQLQKMIDIGVPPIVIMPGIRDVVYHPLLIVGYDEIEKTVFHYVSEPDKIGAIPEEKFDELWAEDDRLMLLLVPSAILSEINLQSDNKEKSNRLCFRAEKLRLQGKLNEAIDVLKKALEINKSNSTAMCLLGGILNDQNSPAAIQYYQKSIEINPRCYLAYRGLGNYFLKTKDYEKAEKYYTGAIEINPQRFAPIYKNRGIALLEQNKMDQAKEDFTKYLEQMPNASDKVNIINAIKNLERTWTLQLPR